MRRSIPRLGALSLLACTLASGAYAASCGDSRRATTPSRAELPRPALRIVAVTDLQGYLEPCGCQSRPLGGVDKMAATVSRLRRDGVPTLFVAAGDLLFDGTVHVGVDDASGGSTQELWKAETLVDILGRARLDAAAPGPHDFRHGAGELQRLTANAPFALLSAGLRAGGATLRGSVVKTLGGLKVGLVGITDLTATGASTVAPQGVEAPAEGILDAARAEVANLRAQRVDVIVALVSGTRRASRDAARTLEGVDFVIQGGLDDPGAIPPTSADRAVLFHASRQGQGVTAIDVFRRPGAHGPWVDVSEWSRTNERTRLDERIHELAARITAWEHDPSVDARRLAEQRARLAELRGERQQLDTPVELKGNGVSARFEELGPEVQGDRAIGDLMDAYDQRVNRHNREAFANVLPRPAVAGTPSYVGSAQCRSCHAEAYRFWQTTKHGHAYATLQNVHKEFNLSCVGCHVTGYNEPGGSNVTHVTNLTDVGCENCHGPGSEHVADPTATPVTVRLQVAETTCLRCHTPEHSDRFVYAAYRQMILGPGHAERSAGGSSAPRQGAGAAH